MVILATMPRDTWERWRAASIRGYARDMVRVGAWPAEGAEERAAVEFARLVPNGLATPGHEFWSILNEAGETVGAIWFGPETEIGHGTGFIWDIAIDEDHRGRGTWRPSKPSSRSRGHVATTRSGCTCSATTPLRDTCIARSATRRRTCRCGSGSAERMTLERSSSGDPEAAGRPSAGGRRAAGRRDVVCYTAAVHLPAAVHQFIERGQLGHVVTLEPDGTPHVSLAWVGTFRTASS